METAVTVHQQETPVPVQSSTDAETVGLWMHSKAERTRAAYVRDIDRFAAFIDRKPLHTVTLGDIQRFADSLEGAPATIRRTLAAVKSLFRFASKIGYIRFDPGAAVTLPALKNDLAARILPEADVQRMLNTDKISPRDAAILRLLYVGGLRASEIAALTWKDLQSNGDAGQVTTYGKGGKTRVVLLTETVWKQLQRMRGDAGPETPVFVSRGAQGKKAGGHLSSVQIFRIVRKAAAAVGIEGNVSPHWIRHCHASHALDAGAPVSLVKATLGHSSVATTSRYLHARPDASSATYIKA